MNQVNTILIKNLTCSVMYPADGKCTLKSDLAPTHLLTPRLLHVDETCIL